MTLESAIYRGLVVHERHRPRQHRLRYRVFSMLLDLDELPGVQGLKAIRVSAVLESSAASGKRQSVSETSNTIPLKQKTA